MADPTAANRFYTVAFGLDTQIRLRASEAPTTGFRGFTLALTVSQPATVNSLIDAALDAGAAPLKPAAKSLWGYGGVVQAPERCTGAVPLPRTPTSLPTAPEGLAPLLRRAPLVRGAGRLRLRVDHGRGTARHQRGHVAPCDAAAHLFTVPGQSRLVPPEPALTVCLPHAPESGLRRPGTGLDPSHQRPPAAGSRRPPRRRWTSSPNAHARAEPSGPWAWRRARALLSDDQAADALYREAIEHLGRCRIAVHLARARLLYGEWLRRQNRRQESRTQLRTAYEAFSRIGADGFASAPAGSF